MRRHSSPANRRVRLNFTKPMQSLKCPNCGLVNWGDSQFCKRCGSDLWHLSQDAPPVWRWFVAYSVLMALLYLFVIFLGGYFLTHPEILRGPRDDPEVMGAVFVVVGLLMMLPFAAAPFLPRKPWVWVFDLVLICLGLTSACCLPASIPLLIFWLRPETKTFFGRNV